MLRFRRQGTHKYLHVNTLRLNASPNDKYEDSAKRLFESANSRFAWRLCLVTGVVAQSENSYG
jgi:hypothetical protein